MSNITFRRLKAEDVFPMVGIISKIGLKNAVKGLDLNEFKNEESVEAAGFNIFMEVIDSVLTNIPLCKKEICDFLSSVSGVDNVEEMDFVEFTELVIEFFQKEEFKDFIKVVSKFIK